MNNIKRSWDLLTEPQRKVAINNIINFYATERGEEIGLISAEQILDMVLSNIGIHLYNKGIDDATQFMNTQLHDLIFNAEMNLKKIPNEEPI